MIGDDVISDVGGAMNCGMKGILVRTGKFRPDDEHRPSVKPTLIVDNFLKGVEAIL
jgi:phospholysine phosphohistidine inorganic pyrophosphate phosphatase